MGYARRVTFPPATNVPYNAGDFTASAAMTWTVDAGDVNGLSYQLMGKRLFLMVDLVTTSVGGVVANAFLQVKIPGGVLPRSTVQIPFTYQDNGGVPTTGYCIITAGSNILSFRPAAGANWTLSANLTRISFSASIEVS